MQETAKNSIVGQAMANLGIAHMAYIKPVSNGKESGYAVHAADGTQLAVFATQEAAYFTAKQHDLEPVRLH